LDDSDNNVLASISRSFVELKKKMSEEIVKILDELIDKNSRRLLIDESDDKFNWVVAHKQLLTVFDNEEGFTARFVNKNLNAILVHINNNLKWIMAREKKPKEAEPTSIDDLAEGTTEDETREYLDNQDDRIRQEEAERLDGTVIEHELNEALKKAGITREDLFKLPKKDFDENVAQFLKVKGLSAKFVDKFKGKISAMLNKKR
ncbi:MAG: hypothetical protein U9O94_11160, partial [Nanoarchaeota archaeon]|nr:hypothetical protein [Nanoarchaeota archaeon]